MTTSGRLLDLADVLKGSTPANTSSVPDGRLFFGQSEISSEGNGELRYLPTNVDLSRATFLRAGDVVVSLLGSVGRSSGVPELYAGAVLGRECAAIRTDAERGLLPGWLLAWTRTTEFANQVARNVTGGTMPRLPARALEAFDVPTPDLVTQQQVERLATSFDAAIRAVGRQLSELKELRDIEIGLAVRDAQSTGNRGAVRPSSVTTEATE